MDSYKLLQAFRDTLYGQVRYGIHKPTQTAVVIKEYNKKLVQKRMTADGIRIAEDAMSEIRIHVKLCRVARHPYIVQVHGVHEDKDHLYTILEYCGKGELFSYLRAFKFTRVHVQHYAQQLLQGVQFCHSQNVCHRDLSLENLLLDDKGILKICDFGVAIESKPGVLLTKDKSGCRPGKLRYMAPEVYASDTYDPRAADIWSCGVILFVMLVGAFPFEVPCEIDKRYSVIVRGNIARLLAAWKVQLDADAIDLLTHMLCPQSRRSSAAELLKHRFFLRGQSRGLDAQRTSVAPSSSLASSTSSSSRQLANTLLSNPTSSSSSSGSSSQASNNPFSQAKPTDRPGPPPPPPSPSSTSWTSTVVNSARDICPLLTAQHPDFSFCGTRQDEVRQTWPSGLRPAGRRAAPSHSARTP